MLPLPALINERELEERPHIRPLARQGDEDRHIGRTVLRIFPIRIEVNRPLIPTNRKIIARDVLTDPHPLGQRVTLDHELVGPVHGLRHRSGARRGDRKRLVHRRLRHISGQESETLMEDLRASETEPRPKAGTDR